MTKTFSNVLGDSKCECSDPKCPVHSPNSNCINVGAEILYRIDMEDNTGTVFCEACGDDAFGSGLFTDSTEDEDEELA